MCRDVFMTTVNVKRYGSYEIDNFMEKDISLNKGIYAIYRVFGDNESLLYLGRTRKVF